MYQLSLTDANQIHVQYKNHTISYGLDGSLPNPLEATYAALAGCAGVYSRKACKAMGISAEGIEINCKPVVRQGNMLIPARFVTEVGFPERISAEQRQRILAEISECAVKRLIHDGAQIEFVTSEVAAA
ncbi:MAG TPA: OsmC family protein [Gallionella sp.]|nr:OsmC family protein [Gallionella sp.]